MKTFTLVTTHGVQLTISAYDYTEDSVNRRVYFHQDENKSDKKTFFVLSEVAGIVECEEREYLTLNQLKSRLDGGRK